MANLDEFVAKQAEINSFPRESGYDVLRIHPKKLALVWDQCYPLLMQSLPANPVMSLDEIITGLSDQSIQFWVVARAHEAVIEAVFLTSIERDKGEWVVSLFNLGGGRAKEWVLDVHEAMHRYARIEDCKRVRMCGRPAWQRILPDYPVVGERGGHLIYERPVGD